MDSKRAGQRGGRSRSAAKRAAARKNGRLGGRPRKAEQLMRRVQQLSAHLLPQLPGIDPGDLSLIVESLLKPAEQRLIIVRPLANGMGHVF